MASRDPRSSAGRPTSSAELLGQVATPPGIALRMARRLLEDRGDDLARPLRVLDPCVGRATFPLAIARSGLGHRVSTIVALDLDPAMVAATRDASPATVATAANYLEWRPDEPFDAAILNPPYVRQEWLDDKVALRAAFKSRYGLEIPGTSNLFVYFIVKVLEELRPGGRFACIVYDSWQSTRFGAWLAQHLLASCEDFRCEAVADQPFGGHLIDATILYGTRRRAASAAPVAAAATERPGPLDGVAGFEPLERLFTIRRGLRLKQADFFLCDLDDRNRTGATPFIKKTGRVRGFAVPADHPEAALLTSARKPSPRVLRELEHRLEHAARDPDANVSILTWHRERPGAWFAHGAAPHAPLIFNYYLRNRPRYLYNPDRAYSDNFYGLVPRAGTVPPLAWLAALNGTAVCGEVLARGRNQGNGLVKLQLFEFRRVRAPDLARCPPAVLARLEQLGRELISAGSRRGAPSGRAGADRVLAQVDACLARAFPDARLSPARIHETYERVTASSRRPREVIHGLARAHTG